MGQNKTAGDTYKRITKPLLYRPFFTVRMSARLIDPSSVTPLMERSDLLRSTVIQLDQFSPSLSRWLATNGGGTFDAIPLSGGTSMRAVKSPGCRARLSFLWPCE